MPGADQSTTNRKGFLKETPQKYITYNVITQHKVMAGDRAAHSCSFFWHEYLQDALMDFCSLVAQITYPEV